VYRLAIRLCGDRRVALAAAALLQATLFIGFGSIFVTPDTTLVVFWFLALLAAAEVRCTGRGAWWLAVGAAVGLAFLSKYSALFLGFGLLVWMIVVPEMRRWLRSPWPYAGGVLALILTLPVLIWNARHDWASFAKQFGRAVPRSFDPSFLPEFLAAQILLLTPFVAVLAVYGFSRALRETATRPDTGSALLVATTLPLLYFLYHSLFARVEGNWTGPLVPALAIVAAAASLQHPKARSLPATILRLSSRWAVPIGVVMALALLLHAEFRLIRTARDPLAQTAGWKELVREVERVAGEHGAGAVAGLSYQVTSALRYFGTGERPALQLTERIRYAMEPQPDAAAITARPVIVLAEPREACRALVGAERAFARVDLIGTLERTWKGAPVELYLVLAASEPRRPGLPDLTIARDDRTIDCSRLRELRR
jgi:4-amino-4-deoxy-L-arabinose transferase-like glycosyltransferase